MTTAATTQAEQDPDFMSLDQLKSRALQANAENAGVYAALDGLATNARVTAGHLRNQGLSAPNCMPAYRAAFVVSGDPEAAWEAARREQLLWLRGAQLSAQAAYDGLKSDAQHFQVDHRARLRSAGDRAIEIQRVGHMPNPWTPGAGR